MRRFLILPAVLLSLLVLPDCGGRVQQFWETATSTQVSGKAVVIAANSFNALKATATNYIRLPRCTGSNGPICRDPQVAAIIIPAVQEGTKARNDLVAFYRRHPNGALGGQGLYDGLLTFNSTLESIYARYNIRSR